MALPPITVEVTDENSELYLVDISPSETVGALKRKLIQAIKDEGVTPPANFFLVMHNVELSDLNVKLVNLNIQESQHILMFEDYSRKSTKLSIGLPSGATIQIDYNHEDKLETIRSKAQAKAGSEDLSSCRLIFRGREFKPVKSLEEYNIGAGQFLKFEKAVQGYVSIYVRNPGNVPFQVAVGFDATIAQLKDAIRSKNSKFAPSSHVILYKGKRLPNEQKLTQLGLVDKTTVTIIRTTKPRPPISASPRFELETAAAAAAASVEVASRVKIVPILNVFTSTGKHIVVPVSSSTSLYAAAEAIAGQLGVEMWQLVLFNSQGSLLDHRRTKFFSLKIFFRSLNLTPSHSEPAVLARKMMISSAARSAANDAVTAHKYVEEACKIGQVTPPESLSSSSSSSSSSSAAAAASASSSVQEYPSLNEMIRSARAALDFAGRAAAASELPDAANCAGAAAFELHKTAEQGANFFATLYSAEPLKDSPAAKNYSNAYYLFTTRKDEALARANAASVRYFTRPSIRGGVDEPFLYVFLLPAGRPGTGKIGLQTMWDREPRYVVPLNQMEQTKPFLDSGGVPAHPDDPAQTMNERINAEPIIRSLRNLARILYPKLVRTNKPEKGTDVEYSTDYSDTGSEAFELKYGAVSLSTDLLTGNKKDYNPISSLGLPANPVVHVCHLHRPESTQSYSGSLDDDSFEPEWQPISVTVRETSKVYPVVFKHCICEGLDKIKEDIAQITGIPAAQMDVYFNNQLVSFSRPAVKPRAASASSQIPYLQQFPENESIVQFMRLFWQARQNREDAISVSRKH